MRVNIEYGGGLGIRTPGRLQTYNGFQDRRLQPLSQSTFVLLVRIIGGLRLIATLFTHFFKLICVYFSALI